MYLICLLIGLLAGASDGLHGSLGARQLLPLAASSYQRILSNVSSAVVPDYMRQLHGRHRLSWRRFVVDIGGRTRQLGVITSVRSNAYQSCESLNLTKEHVLQFSSPVLDIDEVEVARELRLYSDKSFLDVGRIQLYDLNHLTEDEIRNFIKIIQTTSKDKYYSHPVNKISKHEGQFEKENWISFDIDTTRAQDRSRSHYLIRIDRSHTHHLRLRRSVQSIPTEQVLGMTAPHLVTFNRHRNPPKEEDDTTNSHPKNRLAKRRRRKRRRGSRRQKWRKARRLAHMSYCQRRSLHVNFESIGWNNWIVAPQAYNADVCLGSCPFPLDDSLDPTNHAIIQQLVHFYRPGNVAPPCCVPTKLAPESLLYFDSRNQVVLKVYEDMSVVTCGCR